MDIGEWLSTGGEKGANERKGGGGGETGGVEFDAVVLAGGVSARFGGVDKAPQSVAGLVDGLVSAEGGGAGGLLGGSSD